MTAHDDRAALVQTVYDVERNVEHADGERLCGEIADAVIAAGWVLPPRVA